MSRLLGRAIIKRRNAETDYRHINEDECNIDDCCFNLQQSIELTLKYIISANGEKYAETHDISAQLGILDNMGITIPDSDRLRPLAGILNDWEAESNRSDGFTATIQDIDDAREIADSLIGYAKAEGHREE